MTKLYSLFLAFFVTLFCTKASAFTLFVEIDDVSRISEITTYPDQGAIDFSQGKLSITFDDKTTMRYVYVTPVSGKYITSWTIVDEDGIMVAESKSAKSSRVFIQIPDKADYGTLTIKTADELVQDSKVTVEVKGDPSKVQLSFSAKRMVELHEGINELAYTSSIEGDIYIMPVGVTRLYKVTYDGSDVTPWETSTEEGTICYQYHLTQKDGGKIYIETDFPDIYYTCTISVAEGMEDIITGVTLDGEPVADWKNMSVHAGMMLNIDTSIDYFMDSFTVNGAEKVYTDEISGEKLWNDNWSGLVTEDLNINVSGTKIPRNYTVTTKTYGWENVKRMDDVQPEYGMPSAVYSFNNNRRNSLTIPAGEGSLKFGDVDNPFTLHIIQNDESNPVAVTVMINDEIVTASWNTYELELKDGDVLSIYYGVNPTSISNITANETPATATYSIQGVMMSEGSELYRGIWIKNGKKFTVR